MTNLLDTIHKDSIFTFDKQELQKISNDLSILNNQTIQTICDTYNRKDSHR